MASSGHCSTDEAYGRYLTFNWKIESQSIENNTTTISWSLDGDGDGGYVICTNFYVEIDGKVVYNLTDSSWRPKVYNYTTVLNDTYTIKHNADGSRSFSVKIGAGIYDWTRNDWGSGTWSLTTIPRKATVDSAPDFTDEDSPKITYTNKAGNAVNTLQACIASTDGKTVYIPYRDISKTGSSYTFNFTAAEKETLQKLVLSGSNSKQVRFYIYTKIGSYEGYSSQLKTLTIANATPTISPTVVDSNSTTKALTGDANKLIRYHSNAAVAMNPTFKKGASAKTYKITNGDKSLSTASGTFNAVEKNSFTFSVTDNRGLSASQTITKTMVNYVHLTCNLEVNRPNALGEMSLKIHGNCFSGSFGAKNNTLTLKYYFQEEGDVEFTVDVEVTPSNDTYSVTIPVVGLDYRKKYTFRASAWDELEIVDSAVVDTRTLPVFDWSGSDFNFNVPVTFSEGYVNTNKVLWSGASHMNGNQTIPLAEPVSEQANGLVLVFSGYDTTNSAAKDSSINTFFVSKKQVELFPDCGHTFILGINAGFSGMAAKYLYFTDTTVYGHSGNTTSGAHSGITFNNSNYVLRYVIGV